MKRLRNITLMAFLIALQLTAAIAQQAKVNRQNYPPPGEIDLSGRWAFQLDPQDSGVGEKWYRQRLRDTVVLPGSTTTNAKGDDITINTPWTGSIVDSSWFHDPSYARYRLAGNIKIPFWLQPVKYYKGAAWYQKVIDIPVGWTNKHIQLFLERAHWQTNAWVDGVALGSRNSLATAHVYDLPAVLEPGKHILTIRVDNRINDINVGVNSHSLTDHTQTNWNGMVGALYLRTLPPVYIDDVQLYPDITAKQVVARIQLKNTTGHTAALLIRLLASSEKIGVKPVAVQLRIKQDTTLQVVYPMGTKPLLWSEFTPDIYKMKVQLSIYKHETQTKTVLFGMREFSTSGTNFTINGRPVFLRGALECAVFPKTGYPPTDVASWLHIFSACKAYGLNHVRFHSWCPPDAAFEAADRIGLYLQIECSSWANQGAAIGDGRPLDEYIYDESKRIVRDYGNHPSFCMMTYGNEPAGRNYLKYLTSFVQYWKKTDHRRLYTTASGWPIVKETDYNSSADPRIQGWGQGLKSIINNEPPRTDYDWRRITEKWQHPTVSHEVGQWCVYPDFSEIQKYTGILKANNFEIFRDKLQEHGLGNLASDFLYASGKLQVLCYKADIEAALRTPGFGGFQLLGLYDFPGQGTALVGVLNAFWQDKGYVNAQQYSRFCNPVVPLVRLPKMIYLNDEHLAAEVEAAQYGPLPLTNVMPRWVIKDDSGHVIYQGALPKTDIPIGNNFKLGNIDLPLDKIVTPSLLHLSVYIGEHENDWDLFVYPAHLPDPPPSILVTQHLDTQAINILDNGGKVLLTLPKGSLPSNKGGRIAVGFSSIFWNTAWTGHQPPETLGILCDPKHPALNAFPTQPYSNWQWWDAMSHAGAIELDSISPGLQPIIRVIDDWVTARSLGLVFECKVGKGSLLVSGIDLLTDEDKRPEAKQLLYSLEKYMTSADFAPSREVPLEKITSL